MSSRISLSDDGAGSCSEGTVNVQSLDPRQAPVRYMDRPLLDGSAARPKSTVTLNGTSVWVSPSRIEMGLDMPFGSAPRHVSSGANCSRSSNSPPRSNRTIPVSTDVTLSLLLKTSTATKPSYLIGGAPANASRRSGLHGVRDRRVVEMRLEIRQQAGDDGLTCDSRLRERLPARPAAATSVQEFMSLPSNWLSTTRGNSTPTTMAVRGAAKKQRCPEPLFVSPQLGRGRQTTDLEYLADISPEHLQPAAFHRQNSCGE